LFSVVDLNIMKTLKTPGDVVTRLETIGRERVKLKSDLAANTTDMNDTVCAGFELGVTAKRMVEALGVDPETNKPVVGAARIFQIRDGK
jgi:hypothetical protein